MGAFEQPKIFVPAIEDGVRSTAPDLDGYYGNDKTNIIVTEEWRYVLGVLELIVVVVDYQANVFWKTLGGFFEFKPMYVSQLPIPATTQRLKIVVSCIVDAVLATRDSRFEQLINGLVFELFFPDELHAANIRLFDACEQAGVGKLAALQGDALAKATEKLASTIFANDHPIYAMLFDLQALEVVRVIEGRGLARRPLRSRHCPSHTSSRGRALAHQAPDAHRFPRLPRPHARALGTWMQDLLVYGENGAGKSSVFHALGGFFALKPPHCPLREHKNVFSGMADTDCKVAVEFADGSPAVEWTVKSHPGSLGAKSMDVRVAEAALRRAVLDYRALLDTNYGRATARSICSTSPLNTCSATTR